LQRALAKNGLDLGLESNFAKQSGQKRAVHGAQNKNAGDPVLPTEASRE
jgi:hypothetical protein